MPLPILEGPESAPCTEAWPSLLLLALADAWTCVQAPWRAASMQRHMLTQGNASCCTQAPSAGRYIAAHAQLLCSLLPCASAGKGNRGCSSSPDCRAQPEVISLCVLLQTAALRIRSYGEQWLNTIPPHAGRLLRGQSGRQLRQEAWDAHLAAEARLNNRRDPMAAAEPQASAATLPLLAVLGLGASHFCRRLLASFRTNGFQLLR